MFCGCCLVAGWCGCCLVGGWGGAAPLVFWVGAVIDLLAVLVRVVVLSCLLLLLWMRVWCWVVVNTGCYYVVVPWVG